MKTRDDRVKEEGSEPINGGTQKEMVGRRPGKGHRTGKERDDVVERNEVQGARRSVEDRKGDKKAHRDIDIRTG